jgi:two-component system, LytTR family, response regulator
MNIRTVIVDDEPWARSRIAALLGKEPDFAIVSECANVEQAVESISSERPDLIFLDVQLRDRTGFEVIDAIGAESMPLVIFATAYDTYTLQAFDVHALDYLLKPFDEARLRLSLSRARKRLQTADNDHAALRDLLSAVKSERRYLQRLAVTHRDRLMFVRAADVDWLEASGNYVTVHVGSNTYLVRETLNAMESRLHPQHFLRLHRSTIVNIDRIRQLSPWVRGEQAAVLNDGTQLTVGRAYRGRLAALMSNSVEF